MKIILNPSANRRQAAMLAANLRSISPQSAWVLTTSPGEATHLTQQAAAEGCRMVVAAGGDGTVHEVVNGLMQVPAKNAPAWESCRLVPATISHWHAAFRKPQTRPGRHCIAAKRST
ncbi:MAG: hypothetical protein Fur0018_14910 [Anaerolineales bacterium]